MRRVGIIGASGFTGAELLRLIAQHPDFEVAYATFAPHLRVIAPWKEWNIRGEPGATPSMNWG